MEPKYKKKEYDIVFRGTWPDWIKPPSEDDSDMPLKGLSDNASICEYVERSEDEYKQAFLLGTPIWSKLRSCSN